MNIYVSHSRNFDFENELYNPLRNFALAQGHNFIFPHENRNPQGIDAKELFRNKKCDLVLTEVSYPATGQGIELGWANAFDVPVISFHKEGFKISNSLKRITETILGYSSTDDLLAKLSKHLHD